MYYTSVAIARFQLQVNKWRRGSSSIVSNSSTISDIYQSIVALTSALLPSTTSKISEISHVRPFPLSPGGWLQLKTSCPSCVVA